MTNDTEYMRQKMLEKGVKIKDAAQAIGISMSTLSILLKEERNLQYPIAHKLIKYFGELAVRG